MMSDHNPSSTTRPSCPCKRVPLYLSSFTAAEHGDLQSLLRHTQKNNGSGQQHGGRPWLATRRDVGGNTPLHLAAQHGNVAATAFLLRHGCDVNGRVVLEEESSRDNVRGIGNDELSNNSNDGVTRGGGIAGVATPLHRASFSGATSTMRLLIEDPECDLLAHDTSFGDRMTPLHKAIAGGRYRAVQLLLDALGVRNMLREALCLRDACNRTPYELVCEKRNNPNLDDERSSVARWNVIADGIPDWEKCFQLLCKVHERINLETETITPSNETAVDTASMVVEYENIRSQEPLPGLPVGATTSTKRSSSAFLLSSSVPPKDLAAFECMDCNSADGSGKCLTASWEAAFQKALSNAVDAAAAAAAPPPPPAKKKNQNNATDPSSTKISTANRPSSNPATNEHMLAEYVDCTTSAGQTDKANMSNDNNGDTSASLGRKCASCRCPTFALYQRNGMLVCKKCSRRLRR